MLVIFFFQAEDGIRDDLVTGVQTCALPIYRVPPRGCVAQRNRVVAPDASARPQLPRHQPQRQTEPDPGMAGRSEERRVGKEGRSRGAPDHLKKKKEEDARVRGISRKNEMT